MFRLIRTHKPGGDECAPYDVRFDEPYTIGEFVKDVLTERCNEWGGSLNYATKETAILIDSQHSNTAMVN